MNVFPGSITEAAPLLLNLVSFFLFFNKEIQIRRYKFFHTAARGRSRTAATSKMEHFVIIVNGWKPLTIITKSSILDVAAVLDPPLVAEPSD